MDESSTCERFRVLDASIPPEKEIWHSLWQQWPQREVYAHPGYVSLYAEPGTCRALCATWEDGNSRILYPFLLRDLSVEPYWSDAMGPATDIITPYGYGGAYRWGGELRDGSSNGFWSAFNRWSSDNAVVSEFVRFTLFNESIVDYPGERIERSHNVVRSLDLSAEDLWRDFAHKVRKNVKKARRHGVQIEIDPTGERLEDFLRIYLHTMTRNDAGEHYRFSKEYFERIHREIEGHFLYVHALHDGEVVSTELVLVSAESVYSFLGGTVREAFPLRPNDLLKQSIMEWARENGKQNFVLGGGVEPDDGIFRYKLAFAPNGSRPFHVGQRVLQPHLYEWLVRNHKDTEVANSSKAPSFFPAYRA